MIYFYIYHCDGKEISRVLRLSLRSIALFRGNGKLHSAWMFGHIEHPLLNSMFIQNSLSALKFSHKLSKIDLHSRVMFLAGCNPSGQQCSLSHRAVFKLMFISERQMC
jgi:hypothetical protein